MLQDQRNGPLFVFLKSHISAPGDTNSSMGGLPICWPFFYQEIVPTMAICSLKPHTHTLNNCNKHIAYISIGQQKMKTSPENWQSADWCQNTQIVLQHKLKTFDMMLLLLLLRNWLKDSCQVECWSYPKVYQREHYHNHWQDLFLWNIDILEDDIVIWFINFQIT